MSRRRRWAGIWVAATAVVSTVVVAVAPTPVFAASIIVRSAADGAPANDGACTLREAIINANGNSQAGSTDCAAGSGADTILFEISGAGVKNINPNGSLPVITESLTIDGYSQSGAAVNSVVSGASNAVLRIQLNGAFSGNGLLFQPINNADSLQVRGLILNGFGSNAIYINGGTNSQIVGNFIGTSANGLAAVPNTFGITLFNNTGTRIGGSTPELRNVISGNGEGVSMWQGTSGARVQGNLIGVGSDGVTPIGNNGCGDGCNRYSAIVIRNYASSNTIGGVNPGEGNIIANNTFALMAFSGSGNAVLGNSIYSNAGIIAAYANSAGVTFFPGNYANQIQNVPVLDSARLVGADLVTNYTTFNAPGQTTFPVRLEFFRADTYSNRQGRTFLGAVSAATPGTAQATLTGAASSVATGDVLVAIATDAAGNSSEFSAASIIGGLAVTDTGDQPDYGPGDGICEATPGSRDCSLRAAIEEANSSPDRSEITFNIPGSGVQRITPASFLPSINRKANLATAGL